MTMMTTPYQPRPPRPNTLPGLQSLHACRGRHDSPNYETVGQGLAYTPVHMHPDPQNIAHDTGLHFISIMYIPFSLSTVTAFYVVFAFNPCFHTTYTVHT